MDLAQLIERHAAFSPDKAAIRFAGATLTYSDLAQRITAMAQALARELGLGCGDRVAILATNHPDYLVLLYACARIGAILVPINWRLAPAEQAFIVGDASPKALVIEREFAEALPVLQQAHPGCRMIGVDFAPKRGTEMDTLLAAPWSAPPRMRGDLTDPLLIVYTSGTTGRPKGAVLRQDALFWNGVMSQHMHSLTSEDHVLTVLPMFHVGGLNIQTTPALHHGATVTLHDRFSPEATLAAIAQERPTLMVLVPATIQALTEHPGWGAADISSLRAVATGSTQVPQPLVDAIAQRGVPVLQVYGSTETCPIAVYSRLGGDWQRPNSTGLPGLACEARIVGENGTEVEHGLPGEIEVRGPNVFREYWRNPRETEEVLHEGWYRTGDIGERDGDGYFYVRDRKKNMIISGGENIYPAEVERVLHMHPDVAECAVIGRADPKWQEVPIAYVVPRRGATPAAEALRAHMLGQLARFKVPREIVLVASLPRNALGKVQHFRLRAEQERT